MDSGAGDFSLGSSVTIPAGTTLPTDGSHCVAVSGTEDTLLEGDEAFGARISGTDQTGIVSVGASDTATVTITDNDGGNDRNCSSVCLISATSIYVCTYNNQYVSTFFIFEFLYRSQLGRLKWLQLLWVSLKVEQPAPCVWY